VVVVEEEVVVVATVASVVVVVSPESSEHDATMRRSPIRAGMRRVGLGIVVRG
jgi:hypothetical protein